MTIPVTDPVNPAAGSESWLHGLQDAVVSAASARH